MKIAGIIIFTIDLLRTLYAGFIDVTEEKVVDIEELEIIEDNQHMVDWQPYIGIGMMAIGGAILLLGRKKSLAT
jgi:hypothetical protein